MGREKKAAPGAASGNHAKDRHKRDRKGNIIDWTAPLPAGLVARPDKPKPSSKHKSYFEFIENKNKKKKLEFEFTEDREPPPGFEFVPIGNPELTTACKEISREQGAMIFIVTSSNGIFSKDLSLHLNRAGHHIRQSIVDQARESLGHDPDRYAQAEPGQPEPIPEKQEDINKQADAAIRDLFPRIPNTDRQTIIDHAFNKSKQKNGGEPPVGLASHLTLSRRVQLAVLAHIRHTHTRYDQLLRETTYVNARKAVESLCLDYLVKWRGDEETGRDQLDEILCEVVVISDSESDEDDDEYDEDESESGESSVVSSAQEAATNGADKPSLPARQALPPPVRQKSAPATRLRGDGGPRGANGIRKSKKKAQKERKAKKKAQRGFSRYQAVRDQAWHQAVERQRHENVAFARATGPPAMDRPMGNGSQLWRPSESENAHVEQRSLLVRREPSYQVRPEHGSSMYPPEITHGKWERPAQRIVSSSIPHMPQESFGYDTSRSRPIVGSGSAHQPAIEVERVRHVGQDLRDHLLKSIETNSPDTPHFPAQAWTQSNHVQRGFHGEANTADDYQATLAQDGFVRLPPRPEVIQRSAASSMQSHPLAAVSSEPHSVARSHASVTFPANMQRLPAMSRDDGRNLRMETRPIWIDDREPILRSEARPILIQESRPIRPDREQHIATVHHAGPVYVDRHDRWNADDRDARHVESQLGGFAEIVRVSNKFPRPHDPRPVTVEASLYENRPPAPQYYVSQRPREDFRRHDVPPALPPTTHHQRVERVIARYEPEGMQEVVVRPPNGYHQSHERVVGIEYLPTGHIRDGRELHDYSYAIPARTNGGPGGPEYRARTASMAPPSMPPYPGGPPNYHNHQPSLSPGVYGQPRREVITLD